MTGERMVVDVFTSCEMSLCSLLLEVEIDDRFGEGIESRKQKRDFLT